MANGTKPSVRNTRLLLASLLFASLATFATRADEPPGGFQQAERSLRKAVRAGEVREARKILSELARSGEAQGYRAMIDAALDTEDPEIFGYAAGLLARLEGDDRVLVFDALKMSRLASTRIILLAIVARWKDDPRAIDAIHERLSDASDPVVFSALRWIREIEKPELSIPAVVAELERREKGARDRVYFDLRRALKDWTGQELELAADWKSWNAARASGAAPPPPKRGTGRTVLVRSPSFFTVSVESDRVVFVIDTSTSMEETDPVPREGEPRFAGKGTTVVRIPREPGADGEPATRTRLSAVQRELVKLVQSLDEGVRFNIVAFDHELELFDRSRAGGPIEATAANKRRAEEWISALQASGATRTDLALREALSMPDIDTVYLLTDGAPKSETGDRIDPRAIYQLVDRLNLFRKIRIHTIGFLAAGTSMREFVAELASKNDGRCVLLE